jgi:hypothetical protein
MFLVATSLTNFEVPPSRCRISYLCAGTKILLILTADDARSGADTDDQIGMCQLEFTEEEKIQGKWTKKQWWTVREEDYQVEAHMEVRIPSAPYLCIASCAV